MRVINLGEVKDLLLSWEGVRAEILRGAVSGFSLTVRRPDGKQAIYLGGHYLDNHEDAAHVALLASWEMTRTG